jgi:hypothetical protein
VTDATITFELASKMESIFMPYAARRRAAVVERKGRFVHYTSAASGIEIIKTKRWWMRSTSCMADYREVQHGFDILNRFFNNSANRQLFNTTLDGCVKGRMGAGEEAIALFNLWWGDIRSQAYIASISEHDDEEDAHGRLSMWRAFGHGPRVALVFRFPLTEGLALPLRILFSPVAYLTENELDAEMRWTLECIRNAQPYLQTLPPAQIVEHAFLAIVSAVVSLKHEGFREEREWRPIYFPTRLPSPLVTSELVVVDGVPQTVHKLPFDKTVSPEIAPLDIANVLDRVIIGPTQYAEAMKLAFISVLEGAGISNAEHRVVVSGIPIRT